MFHVSDHHCQLGRVGARSLLGFAESDLTAVLLARKPRCANLPTSAAAASRR